MPTTQYSTQLLPHKWQMPPLMKNSFPLEPSKYRNYRADLTKYREIQGKAKNIRTNRNYRAEEQPLMMAYHSLDHFEEFLLGFFYAVRGALDPYNIATVSV